MTGKRNPEAIAGAIRDARSIAICCHISPDGDTIGSALAMHLVLKALGKEPQVFCQDKVPDNLSFLPGAEEIRQPGENPGRFDLMLAVDISDVQRMGGCSVLLERADNTAQIDHHATNPGYACINSIDGNASATCAMIYEQMRFLRVPMTREIAMCLYTGISTDTGNFSFDCTDSEAFMVMSDLMKAELPLADLSMRLFREKSKRQLMLLGRAINGMAFQEDGRLAVMKLTLKDFEECGALSEHADTIVNYGLETVGTQMAVLGRETTDGKVKFSLRSRPPLRVDAAAQRLGGGGHSQAAGITLEGSLDEATDRVIAEMIKDLNG